MGSSFSLSFGSLTMGAPISRYHLYLSLWYTLHHTARCSQALKLRLGVFFSSSILEFMNISNVWIRVLFSFFLYISWFPYFLFMGRTN